MQNHNCKEYALENGFCIFHQSGKVLNKDIEIFNQFNKKINNLIDEEKEVFCIGYNIPFISITGKTIKKPLYFHDAKINISDLRDSIFTDKAIGYFVNAVFEEASFENVIFHDKVLFNNSRFTRESERQGFFFKRDDNYDLKKHCSGYASFKNVIFYNQANFEGVEFSGIVFFDNAQFFSKAIFTESIFCVDYNKDALSQASFHGDFYQDEIKNMDCFKFS
jgi:uncharacterized protein YjbI with pentapeptide repeats